MKFILAVVSLVSLLIWMGSRIVADIQFDRNCGGYMKRAADANTVQLATEQLEKVIMYLEREDLTSGYTSIFFKTPDEDIGFWYTNLNTALEELKKVDLNTATSLEKSNMLMKLRETILDSGDSGVSVTVPSGIKIYPNNAAFCFWGALSFTILVIAGGSWLNEPN